MPKDDDFEAMAAQAVADTALKIQVDAHVGCRTASITISYPMSHVVVNTTIEKIGVALAEALSPYAPRPRRSEPSKSRQVAIYLRKLLTNRD